MKKYICLEKFDVGVVREIWKQIIDTGGKFNRYPVTDHPIKDAANFFTYKDSTPAFNDEGIPVLTFGPLPDPMDKFAKSALTGRVLTALQEDSLILIVQRDTKEISIKVTLYSKHFNKIISSRWRHTFWKINYSIFQNPLVSMPTIIIVLTWLMNSLTGWTFRELLVWLGF